MMIQGQESGYTAPSAMNLKGRAGHAHGDSCLCSHSLAGTEDANSHSGEVVEEPEGVNLWPKESGKIYVRFCNLDPLLHTVLRSPVMSASGRPLDAGSVDPVEDVAYEVIRLATPKATPNGVLGQGLENYGFEPVWALVKKPKAKSPLNTFDGNGWVLLRIRFRNDGGQAPFAEVRDGLPYKTTDIFFGEVSKKSSVKPDKNACNGNRILLAGLDDTIAKIKASLGTHPPPPPAPPLPTPPKKGDSGVLFAIGAAAGLYLLTKR